MCGVAGYYYSDRGAPVDVDREAVLRAMTDALEHRGPDGDGYFVGERCGLGHRRLKIIDLSERARQPMCDGERRVFVSFNGEIYNHKEIRRELEPTYRFTSASDTEVIVHGYSQWGTGVFARLNGMFAIALWDERLQTLHLVRDRLGKKPLFYFWNGRECVFGSELKAILAHPAVSPAVDQQSLVQYLAFGYVPTPRSIFEGVRKVTQGSFVSFHGDVQTESLFWSVPKARIAISEADALEELDRLVTRAVARRLESDVPLGFLLSGGVDSSLVTAIGQKLHGGLKTFSVGFHSASHDEAPHARAIADRLGTDHEELYLDEDAFSDFIDRAPIYFDEPFADSSCIPSYCLSRLTRRHVTVAVSGDGGDELFGGYPKYRDLSRAEMFFHLPLVAREPLAWLARAWPNQRIRKMGTAVSEPDLARVMRWLVCIWKEDELRCLIPDVKVDWDETEFSATFQRFADRDPVARMMVVDAKTYLCDDILQKMDRASMAVALEVRSPLLDVEVVEFAMSLPDDLKRRGATEKYLLKRLLERYIPKVLWDRPKQGLSVPLKGWYRGRRRSVIESLRETLPAAYPVLRGDAIQRAVDTHVAGRADFSQKVFALDMLNLWTAKYGVN